MSDEPDPLIAPVAAAGPSPAARLGLDLFWAYAAAGAKVLSWVVVSGLVFRKMGGVELGLLALARATVGILNYAGVGLLPALVHRMTLARAPLATPAPSNLDLAGGVLPYATPASQPPPRSPLDVAYTNGLAILLGTTALAVIPLVIYAYNFPNLHHVPSWRTSTGAVQGAVLLIGIGTLLRLISDVAGAALQASGRVWVDYLILTLGELIWMALVWERFNRRPQTTRLDDVAVHYILASIAVLILRAVCVGSAARFDWRRLTTAECAALLSFGVAVAVGQLADFLYSPIALIIIQQLLGAEHAASYTPAVQIDSGLLLLVSGLTAVILPRAARAFDRGDITTLRRYYVRGAALSFLMLLAAALIIWAASPRIFRLWFDNDMPATRAILPLVLASTVVGGTAGIGRSVLLGMGRVKAYTISALVAGVMNVLLGYVFVKYAGLGLKGIALGTLCVVVARCAIWMPWYVLRVTSPATTAPSRSSDPMGTTC
jgi:O-antigen/teichoic acid export membrane protein